MKRLLLLLAAVVALAACSDPPVEGVVEHKQHSDAYDYVTMVCGAYGTNGACSAWIPIFNHMPASWQVCIHGLDKNGKVAEGCIEISEAEYGRYDEGSHYPRNGA